MAISYLYYLFYNSLGRLFNNTRLEGSTRSNFESYLIDHV